MWSMHLFFLPSYVALKMEEKVTMWLKSRYSNHWFMVRLNLSSDDLRTKTKDFFWKTQTARQVYSSKTRKSVRKVFKTRSGNEF